MRVGVSFMAEGDTLILPSLVPFLFRHSHPDPLLLLLAALSLHDLPSPVERPSASHRGSG